MKILIVDDTKENLYFLETLLKKSGYEVVSAGDGAEALETLHLDGFDIIISDILMPVMDGFQFCSEVKQDDSFENIPFIFCTASYKDKKDEELAIKLGADSFIRMPVEPNELIKIIQDMLKDRKEMTGRKKPALVENKDLLKLYNEHLVKKLEKKKIDLESEIAERKKAEEELKKHREHLEELVEERTAEIKELNKDLEHRLFELDTANKELEAFSYSVSHDLRAPLRVINGFSRILLEDHSDKLDGEGERVVNVICSNTRKMGNLIEDLLEFSRIGRKKVHRSRINMERLVEAVYDELKTSVTGRNLRLKLNTLPYAYGDEPMIHEVMGNLISNAIKFTCFKDTAVIEVGGKEENDEILYYVKDNGAGFDMKYADKLFGVFQRLHSSEDFEGTGVGLALVKRIIDKHGGRVWAEGKVDEGATFYFTLPKKGELNNEQ